MTPGPVELHPRVLEALSGQVVSHRGQEFHSLYSTLLEHARRVFQTGGDVLVMTSSATLAVECAVANPLQPGEKLLVPVHGIFGERMAEAAETYGLRVVRLQGPWDEAAGPEQVEEALARDPDIKAVALVHNETSTGAMVSDMVRLAEAVKCRGRLLIVDAVSSLGGVPLPVDKLGIDICVAGAQKCLAGPPGLSLLSVSEEAWKSIERRERPLPAYIDLRKHKEFLARMETPFTPAVNLLYGLNEALTIILEEGLSRWQEKHARCSSLLYHLTRSLGLKPYPKEMFRSITVIALQVPEGINGSLLLEELEVRGLVAARGMGRLREKLIRIACMGNITEEKVEQAAQIIAQTLEYLQKPRIYKPSKEKKLND